MRNFRNFSSCNLTAAAVTQCRPAQPRPTALQVQRIPGRKSSNPANPRDLLSQPQRAHDHGNSFSGSEGQPHSAICESTLAPGSTVAQHHVRLPLPRDKPAVQALAIGASGTQQMRRSNQETFLYRIGQEKTPKGEIRLRARRYGARAHRKLASALLSHNSNAQHRSQFESKRSLGRLDLCCSRYFRFCHALVLALCAPKQVLCRFSSAAPRTACKLQLRSHAQHAGPQCLNQLRKQLRKRLFPALSALSSP